MLIITQSSCFLPLSTLSFSFRDCWQISTIQVCCRLHEPLLQHTNSCEIYWRTMKNATASKIKDCISNSHDHWQSMNCLLNWSCLVEIKEMLSQEILESWCLLKGRKEFTEKKTCLFLSRGCSLLWRSHGFPSAGCEWATLHYLPTGGKKCLAPAYFQL